MKQSGLFILVLLVAIALRAPFIGEGLPYFQKEDEGHHFNRVVEMVKTGSFNPKYFHKPSLHFYLRMPVVAASYLLAAKKGAINSIQEIRTRDEFGLGGYSFTASHPGIVKWNRAFSVLLSVITVAITFIIGSKLSRCVYSASVAALLVAVSPDLLKNSAVIGVDTLMSVLCLGTVLSALFTFHGFSLFRLAVTGLLSGLAVSSKYNALPIVVLPFLIPILTGRHKDWRSLVVAALAPCLGFLIGSPFILAEIPLFLDHLSYEVWHYAVAGHEGHMEKPGVPQLIFYLKWLSSSAVGLPALIFSIGVLYLAKKNPKAFLIFLAFPVLYFTMMVFQRANFTRNMIVIVPFVALAASMTLGEFLKLVVKSERGKFISLVGGALIMLTLPFQRGVTEAINAANFLDSRDEGDKILSSLAEEKKEAAISGALQFSPNSYKRPGARVIDETKIDIDKLYQDGFDSLVLGTKISDETLPFLKLEKHIGGNKAPQRIVTNPEIFFWTLSDKMAERVLGSETLSSYTVSLTSNPSEAEGPRDEYYGCKEPDLGEEHCWVRGRLSPLNLLPPFPIVRGSGAGTFITMTFIVRSPWDEQVFSLRTSNQVYAQKLSSSEGFQEVSFRIPADEMISSRENLIVGAAIIHSPRDFGINKDGRRLGIAIKGLKIEGGIG